VTVFQTNKSPVMFCLSKPLNPTHHSWRKKCNESKGYAIATLFPPTCSTSPDRPWRCHITKLRAKIKGGTQQRGPAEQLREETHIRP